jgi:mycothiol synthase
MSLSHIHPGQLPPSSDDPTFRMIPVPAARQAEAVARLVSQGPRDDPAQSSRFMEYAATHGISLQSMWGLVDSADRLIATVLAVPSPGRTAMVFASHPRSPQQVTTVGRLIEHACRQLAAMHVDLAQMLLDPTEHLERQAALSGGMTELALLSYLERPLPRPRHARPPQWPEDVAVETYSEALHPHLLEALTASYEQTLDCPGLLGLRDTKDILEGHRASGQFDPALWTLIRVGGQAAGVLLLNPSPGSNSIELVYLGLAPAARGRGLGGLLLAHGLAQLAGRRERCITLAVDEANGPALKLYQSHGFRPVLRRIALIRPLRVSTSAV